MVELSEPNVDSMTVTATNDDAGRTHHALAHVRRNELRRPDLIDRQDREVREVREQVDDQHRERPEDDRARQVSLAVLHFATGEREIGPTIERPQAPRRARGRTARARKLPGRKNGVKCPPVFGSPIDEREQNDEQEPAVFRERRRARHEGAPPDPDDVERRRENDRPRRGVTGVRVVRRHQRIVAEDPEEVLGERDGDGTDRRRANDDELRPAEEERRQPSPSFAQEDVDAAGFRERAGDLRERERTAHGEHDRPRPRPPAWLPARAVDWRSPPAIGKSPIQW